MTISRNQTTFAVQHPTPPSNAIHFLPAFDTLQIRLHLLAGAPVPYKTKLATDLVARFTNGGQVCNL